MATKLISVGRMGIRKLPDICEFRRTFETPQGYSYFSYTQNATTAAPTLWCSFFIGTHDNIKQRS